jgi:putative membrane protein
METAVLHEDTNTRLAVERTLLAHERTLQAWVRTAASLISFGFTIYKFFQLEAAGKVHASQVIGPRAFASLMIIMGIVGLALATLQNRQEMKRMRREHPWMKERSLAGWIAAMISVLGILAIVSVIFNW